ncbi:DNA polymerase Y family protein [Rhizobium lentis]|uniref:DNA-directed DNA polymerase n=1 Tax=Rhizobium lentis TaxID=1138194 RepID=A0A7W9CX54_9HYPH|nr:DNA polymerase Y family protein [Rhizobium lentis]MBB4576545.1 protein ImuB [Rhizobium lentis]MBB5552590.1 protein ImuB [Rhizobium lentis]MBB5563129.1 protein ImuB [Rhizobium lentis]MBB5569407.1 protein ImuB [Rhizobium lentis]
MARVVSVFLPTLPTDRIRRADPSLNPDTPLVVIARSGSKRWVAAADPAAHKLGLRVGMPAAKAQALVQGLAMIDADPAADLATLERLTLWALSQYSPVVAMDPPDGIVMDTEGADHLQGGEDLMLSGLVNRFRGRGLSARAAIADSWGAAHALARSMDRETVIIPRGETAKAVNRLPLSSLRLPAEIVGSLRTLGFATVGDLAATPRAPLTLRFGSEVGRRLNQIFGRLAEPIDPIRPADLVEVQKSFAEPIGAAETIEKYVSRLVRQLCLELEKRGLGVRRADLIVHRVDNKIQSLRAGTAKPVRDVAWLTKLFRDRIEKIEPGFGIEKLSLAAIIAEPLVEMQSASSLIEERITDVTPLIDVLGNRGGQRIFRVAPVASDVPERSVQRIAPTADEVGTTWPLHWPRPSRLLPHPETIEVIALLPDHPPVSFTWRGKRRRVKRADGPERIFGEWWQRSSEWVAVRDYFVVEDDAGERFWIFRSGDGVDADTGSRKWFLHGVFA